MMLKNVFLFLLLATPFQVFGAESTLGTPPDFTASALGIAALLAFIVAYVLVIGEEFLHLRKSKPVVVAAGIIWLLVGTAYIKLGQPEAADEAFKHNLLEYGELLLFLLAAMTYINTMNERQVFSALRSWLVSRGFTLRAVFWITGLLAFFISPFADNLTTALLMGAVVMAVGGTNSAFVVPACINIVVAANAGGAFSPFGDITTLMVWQSGKVHFAEFFALFMPALVNWLVPAALMALGVPRERPEATAEKVVIRRGGLVIVALFMGTIALAIITHQFFHLPPVLGMMTGLGVLKFFGYYLKRMNEVLDYGTFENAGPTINENQRYDIFSVLARSEWDTLMFFYGVVLCVGGLGALGYLTLTSQVLYAGLGTTWANVLVGLLSSVVDNIPVMFAVISMDPPMSAGQWLLVTLTAGVGGSLLSIGSAAGVALMGQARGTYTFLAHLKWSWAIALGYAASVWVHFLVNAHLM